MQVQSRHHWPSIVRAPALPPQRKSTSTVGDSGCLSTTAMATNTATLRNTSTGVTQARGVRVRRCAWNAATGLCDCGCGTWSVMFAPWQPYRERSILPAELERQGHRLHAEPLPFARRLAAGHLDRSRARLTE